ncbi:hypothetical protein AMECASPLE_014630 [Ameca splendens]|uniref:Secreted protein n=1 Tax=Ameca splendens TaxID=208324 RepID=A0ABV1AA60_9TELE
MTYVMFKKRKILLSILDGSCCLTLVYCTKNTHRPAGCTYSSVIMSLWAECCREKMWAGQRHREASLITESHHSDVMERGVYVDTATEERRLDNKESYSHGNQHLRH